MASDCKGLGRGVACFFCWEGGAWEEMGISRRWTVLDRVGEDN